SCEQTVTPIPKLDSSFAVLAKRRAACSTTCVATPRKQSHVNLVGRLLFRRRAPAVFPKGGSILNVSQNPGSRRFNGEVHGKRRCGLRVCGAVQSRSDFAACDRDDRARSV